MFAFLRPCLFVALSLVCWSFDIAGIFVNVYTELVERGGELSAVYEEHVSLRQHCFALRSSYPPEPNPPSPWCESRTKKGHFGMAFVSAVFALGVCPLLSLADFARKLSDRRGRIALFVAASLHALLQITTMALVVDMYETFVSGGEDYGDTVEAEMGPAVPLYIVSAIVSFVMVCVVAVPPPTPLTPATEIAQSAVQHSTNQDDPFAVIVGQGGPHCADPHLYSDTCHKLREVVPRVALGQPV